MKSAARRIALLLALGLWAAGFSTEAGVADDLRLLEVRSGESVQLDADGSLTHVVFFATWCPPCLDELPGLGELEARWSDGGYRLVLVAVENRHTLDRLRRFVESRTPPGQVLFDQQGEAQIRMKADQIPTHLLIDSQGQILHRGGGLDREIRDRIEKELGDSRRPRRR